MTNEPESQNTFAEKKEIYHNAGYDTSQTICFWMIVAIIFMGIMTVGYGLKCIVDWVLL